MNLCYSALHVFLKMTVGKLHVESLSPSTKKPHQTKRKHKFCNTYEQFHGSLYVLWLCGMHNIEKQGQLVLYLCTRTVKLSHILDQCRQYNIIRIRITHRLVCLHLQWTLSCATPCSIAHLKFAWRREENHRQSHTY